jgi:uncharacterized protein (DUF305 family)
MMVGLLVRRTACVLMFLAWVPARSQTKHPEEAVAAAAEPNAERKFLLWKIADANTSEALARMCTKKRVNPELKSLCEDMIHRSELEAEIASRYLVYLYKDKVPPSRETRSSLASKDGPEFEAHFLRKMIQQDKDGRKKAQACLAQASQDEILFFCHTVERSRWLEIALLRNQLCRPQAHCSLKLFDE